MNTSLSDFMKLQKLTLTPALSLKGEGWGEGGGGFSLFNRQPKPLLHLQHTQLRQNRGQANWSAGG